MGPRIEMAALSGGRGRNGAANDGRSRRQ